MNREEIKSVAEWLLGLDVPFVIVGGSAIEQLVSAGTKDVDVLIAVGDWEKLDKALENTREASPLEPYTGTIRGTRLGLGTELLDLEFLSSEPFAGTRTADEFLDYIRTYRSNKFGMLRYATPAAVWYMRLSIEDSWEQYVSKIRREIVAGIPESTFDDVSTIADHFGVSDRIRERVAFARKTLGLYGRPP